MRWAKKLIIFLTLNPPILVFGFADTRASPKILIERDLEIGWAVPCIQVRDSPHRATSIAVCAVPRLESVCVGHWTAETGARKR